MVVCVKSTQVCFVVNNSKSEKLFQSTDLFFPHPRVFTKALTILDCLKDFDLYYNMNYLLEPFDKRGKI